MCNHLKKREKKNQKIHETQHTSVSYLKFFFQVFQRNYEGEF